MVKHQSNCYRTVDGVRWPNLCDLLEGPKQLAYARAARRQAVRVKIHKHPEGYHQMFVHPEDVDYAAWWMKGWTAGGGDA